MKRPCTEMWCGKCLRTPEDDPCPNCKPCVYRNMAFVPRQSKMTPEELRKTRNRAHRDHRKVHVITYTAREDGVVCGMDALFKYHAFYRLHVSETNAAKVERFFQRQLKQDYNCTGIMLNFLACFRFCCPYGTYWIDIDGGDGSAITPRKWFCSEIVTTALELAEADGFTPTTRSSSMEPCALTPDNIADIVMRTHKDGYSKISEKDVMLALQHEFRVADDDDSDSDDDGLAL